MISVEHLSKKYAAAIAVDDISFSIGKNEIVGFLGPNGAGKSTTLKVLTCFHSATSGKITVDGHDVFENPQAVKAVIGYLPENVPLYPELRVREYLSYRAGLKMIPRAKRTEAIEKAVSRCRIDDVKDRIIGQLSKGFRQRVGLADALLADPKILILDEPTVGLDPNQIRDVRELIRELGKERTVILSSHILPEVEAVCSRVIIINRGKIVGQGRPDDLRSQLNAKKDVVVVEVVDPENQAVSALSKLTEIENVEAQSDAGIIHVQPKAGTDVREQIFDAAVSNRFKILGMRLVESTLEEIFVEIITQEKHAKAPESTDAASSTDKTEVVS